MKLFVATPTYNHHVVQDYAHSLVRDAVLATKSDVSVLAPIGVAGTLIHASRYEAFKAFVEDRDFDTLLFIDADLGWDDNGIMKILETPGDIAGGVYRFKQDEVGYPFHLIEGEEINITDKEPWMEVAGVPGGFMRITRAAAEKINAEFNQPFRHLINEKGEDIGEDYSFCRRARQIGLSVFARFDIEFRHYGVTSWSGAAINDLRAPATEGE